MYWQSSAPTVSENGTQLRCRKAESLEVDWAPAVRVDLPDERSRYVPDRYRQEEGC